MLKNIPGIRDAEALQEFETVCSLQRSDEPLPRGRFSIRHYCAVHRHLFQDVYRRAGRYRTVRIAKGASSFCYPENIPREMTRVFGDLRNHNHLRDLASEEFAAQSAQFLSELNAIHPFRDGNGRTQVAFLAALADSAGHPLVLARLEPDRWLDAMIQSFVGTPSELTAQIHGRVD